MIESNSQEKLYIANSEQLIKLIYRCHMQELFDEEMYQDKEENKQSTEGQEVKNKHSFMFNLFHIDGAKASDKLERKNSIDEAEVEKINNREILLNNVRKKFEDLNIKIVPYERQIGQGSLSQVMAPNANNRNLKKRNDYYSKAFYSTPNFIDDLTEISVRVLKSQSKMKYLKKCLTKMNNSLPAACYMPIQNKDQRNYMVLKICEEESRLFITAEKAPFLICMEVFQPQELELHINNELNVNRPRAYELMSHLGNFNKDQNELLRKINFQLSKPQFVGYQHNMESDNANDESIMQKMQINMKKYHDITIEAFEQSSLEDDEYTPANIRENGVEVGSEGGPSPNHKNYISNKLQIDVESYDKEDFDEDSHSQVEAHYGFYQSENKYGDTQSQLSSGTRNTHSYDTAVPKGLGGQNENDDQDQDKNEIKKISPDGSNVQSEIQNNHEQNLEQILKFETVKEQEERIRSASPFGALKTWKLIHVIVKSGDDLRSEQFAMQLIETINLIFKRRKLKLSLTTYDILSTGENCGIVQFIPESYSIDYIKQKIRSNTKNFSDVNATVDLKSFYKLNFTGSNRNKVTYKQAINNLADSLAAYSLVCHIFQIKDRHNANILINMINGNLVHIDFGFILSSRMVNFERAPFKITNDIIQLLGGIQGDGFKRFRERMVEGFQAIHEDNEKIIVLVQMLGQSQQDLPCFKKGVVPTIKELKQRLTPLGPYVKLNKTQCAYQMNVLINEATASWSTAIYDKWQYCCQGIF